MKNVPWKGVGFDLPEGQTIKEWQKAARLAWSVRARPVLYDATTSTYPEDHEYLEFPKRQVLFRKDNNRGLSIVSDKYQIVQPRHILRFFKQYVEELGLFRMAVAGQLLGGRRIWALAVAPKPFRLAKGDDLGRWLLLSTSYDRSAETVVQQIAMRNETMVSFGVAVEPGQKSSMSKKHSTSFDGEEVKQRLDLDTEWAVFTKLMKKATKRTPTAKERERFLLDVFFPDRFRKPRQFRALGAERFLERLHSTAYTELPTGGKTLWDLINVVGYHIDHQIRRKSLDLRLDRAWFGTGAVIKHRAVSLAHQMIEGDAAS